MTALAGAIAYLIDEALGLATDDAYPGCNDPEAAEAVVQQYARGEHVLNELKKRALAFESMAVECEAKGAFEDARNLIREGAAITSATHQALTDLGSASALGPRRELTFPEMRALLSFGQMHEVARLDEMVVPCPRWRDCVGWCFGEAGVEHCDACEKYPTDEAACHAAIAMAAFALERIAYAMGFLLPRRVAHATLALAHAKFENDAIKPEREIPRSKFDLNVCGRSDQESHRTIFVCPECRHAYPVQNGKVPKHYTNGSTHVI